MGEMSSPGFVTEGSWQWAGGWGLTSVNQSWRRNRGRMPEELVYRAMLLVLALLEAEAAGGTQSKSQVS